MFLELALIALTVEALGGYPKRLYQAIGHPVSWIGRLISFCDQVLNSSAHSFEARRLTGLCALLIILSATFLICVSWWLILNRVIQFPYALILSGVAASTLIAQRSLYDHVAAVADGLERDGILAGRSAVSMIVGRDTTHSDERAVSRAAIESLSENFSDGVVAPVFWLSLAGLPGAALYKAINTADSMIGHKNDRYLAFGWAAARLDDLVNLPASRLSALWICSAAFLLPGADGRGAVRAVFRDASKHKSPNAGWPEAAMAGALGLRLAGPRTYAGVPVADHWMGDGNAAATARDIRRALQIYRLACLIQAVVMCTLLVALLV